jgi:hypothetical protein
VQVCSAQQALLQMLPGHQMEMKHPRKQGLSLFQMHLR